MGKTGFMAAMERADREALIARGRRTVYQKNGAICEQGLPGDTMLVIETGRAQVAMTSDDGQRIVLGQLGPGDLAGEFALFDRAPRSADVIASTPVTGVLLSFSDVKGFLVEHPQVMFAVLVHLAGKLRDANILAETRAMGDGSARLARCLLRLAERWGEGAETGPITLREQFSQSDIGELAGLSRENVNRRMRAWSKEGLIGKADGRLVLQHPDRLRELAINREF
ncbi:MAG: Crp/Fnr family transcriptional regulator [Pseudomonadota bacterium]